jgi:HK97 gp10 family phage protein
MSVLLDIYVDNGQQLTMALQNMSDNLSQAIQDALQLVGNRIFEDMRNFTPVRTGYLLSTESLEMTGQLAFTIYARAYYAPFVEWGTRHMAARHFMTRAFEMHRDEVQQEVLNAVCNLAATMFS